MFSTLLMFRFIINYELGICSFIAFQAFLRRVKKSLSGAWIALFSFRIQPRPQLFNFFLSLYFLREYYIIFIVRTVCWGQKVYINQGMRTQNRYCTKNILLPVRFCALVRTNMGKSYKLIRALPKFFFFKAVCEYH